MHRVDRNAHSAYFMEPRRAPGLTVDSSHAPRKASSVDRGSETRAGMDTFVPSAYRSRQGGPRGLQAATDAPSRTGAAARPGFAPYSNRQGGGYEIAEYRMRPPYEFRAFDKRGYQYTSVYDKALPGDDASTTHDGSEGYQVAEYEVSEYAFREYDAERDFREYKSVYDA
jgi:hypothetical protein